MNIFKPAFVLGFLFGIGLVTWAQPETMEGKVFLLIVSIFIFMAIEFIWKLVRRKPEK